MVTAAVLLGLGLVPPAPTAPATADSVNLLSNPGFEESATAISHWTRFPSDPLPPDSNTSVSVSTAHVHSAQNSVFIVDGNGSAAVGLFSDFVNVTADVNYTVGASIRVVTGSTIVYLKFYSSLGVELGQVAKTVTGPANLWTQVRLDGTPPSNATKARVLLYSSSANLGTAYADDVTLTAHPNQLKEKNPGFEMLNSDGVILNWLKYPTATTVGITSTTAQHHTGSKSVKFTDSDDSAQVGLYTAALMLPANSVGTSYSASAYVMRGTDKPVLALKFYNSGDAQVGNSMQAAVGDPGQWEQLRVESVVPATATYARVLITSGTDSTGGTESYIDDVTFADADPVVSAYGGGVDLGEAVKIRKTLGGAFGNGQVYFALDGAIGEFYALDAATGAVDFQQAVPGLTETHAVTVGSDGNAYFGNTSSGSLWKYDPAAKKVTALGEVTSDDFIWDLDASSDGMLYGGTSSTENGKLFSYNTAGGAVADFGTVFAGEHYVRGVGVDDDYVYAGTGGNRHLIRYLRSDPTQYTEIPLPGDGTGHFIHNIWSYDNMLYVRDATKLIVLDATTFQVKLETQVTSPDSFDGMISPPSPANANLLYFRNPSSNSLWTYNVSGHSIQEVLPKVTLTSSTTVAMGWVTAGGHQVLGILSEDASYRTYDPQSGQLTPPLTVPALDTVAVNLNSMAASPGCDTTASQPTCELYLGGYISGMSIFDEGAGQYAVQEGSPGQIVQTGFLKDRAYIGTYPDARIYSYDPSQGYSITNPSLSLTSPPGNEDRPIAFATGTDKIFVGSVPDYNTVGGSLLTYTEGSGWAAEPDFVPDQTIVSLANRGDTLFGGTSIYGGLGKDPTTTTAQLFELNTATGNRVVPDWVPEIPGMATPELLGGLSFGPDGRLWGAAYGQLTEGGTGFAIYAMNPDTTAKEIVKSTLIYYGSARGNTWREFYLDWGPDGMLYTNIARYVTVIDPATLGYRKLSTGTTHVLALGKTGTIYYGTTGTYGAHLFKFPRLGD
ncbi:hypothetical protein GCM10022239_06020 [Leifsonia bigeumensis]|uniref:CBM-cenC domain-containing protein n=1 Tax=Leifsonella bigeumensis TaxID=433643 RepID=A0ABP7F876_9MICO